MSFSESRASMWIHLALLCCQTLGGGASVVPKAPESQASMWIHLALLCGQSLNGGASVVAKVGLPHINPVFFAMLRELLASPLLFVVAFMFHGYPSIAWKDVPVLGFAAFSLFSAQLALTIGLKLANPVVGSAWQPSQPVFALAFAVMLGWEKATVPKTVGVLCALTGGAVMMFSSVDAANCKSSYPLVGNLLFFYNCMMTAVFVLCMRVLIQRMPAYHAISLAYTLASVGIAVVALLVSADDGLQHFFCPDCAESFWLFPPEGFFALAYWVLGCSVSAYLLLTFGTKYAKNPTHCLVYTAMQPVIAGVLEAMMIAAGWNHAYPASQLKLLNSSQVCGACIVVVGILCVALENKICPRLQIKGADRESASLLNLGTDHQSLEPLVQPPGQS